ncbi:MAG: Kelch repeat-containing protein [Acidimicrobiales bacterium]
MTPPRRTRSRTASLLVIAVAIVCAACSDDGPAGLDGGATTPGPTSNPAGAPAELPVPRTEVAGTAWDGRLVVAGGLTADGGASDLVHFWDRAANRWTAGPPLPVALHHAAMAVLGGRAVVVGGYTNGVGQTWVAQATVFSLGAGEAAWRSEVPLPGPRGAAGAAVAGGLLVVAGGEVGGEALATTSIYDPATRAWRPGPDLAHRREHLASAAAGGRVYAIAGRTAADGNLRRVQSLDPLVDQAWRDEPELADARGGIGATVSAAGRVCVAGGEEPAGTIASVECLDAGGWTRVGRLARPRHGLAVMAMADGLHVVAGGQRPGLFVSGIHEVVDPADPKG